LQGAIDANAATTAKPVSFNDAFAANRLAYGPNATFEWTNPKTGVTGTYTTGTATEATAAANANIDAINTRNLATNTAASGTVAAQTDTTARNASTENQSAVETNRLSNQNNALVLGNAANQSLAETQRLVNLNRGLGNANENEAYAETQRLMESGDRSTLDNLSAISSQALGTTIRGAGSFITNAGRTYAALTGDMDFSNAATKLGEDIESIAKTKDIYGLDVQKNRINQSLTQANETDDWWGKASIVGSAIVKNNIGFADIAGSEAVEEIPETALLIAATLTGAGLPVLAAISASGTTLETFGGGAKTAYDNSIKQGDSKEVAENKAYVAGVAETLLGLGPDMIANKALVAPFAQ
jgi:hypothetical protein